MKKVLLVFTRITSKIIGTKNLERLLIFCAKSINVNLHVHGLVQIGALNGYYRQIISEHFFIEKILPGLFENKEKLIFFDVGANVGNYAIELRRNFPNANIYCFEPIKSTFEMLAKNTIEHNIKLYNIGFSNAIGKGELFNTADGANTEIASAYKEVFPEIFKNKDKVTSIEFEMDTIDNFCKLKNITNLDFLKIDVEGHELTVLKGALDLLLSSGVKAIQFEFNSHNVYSRVFLRDFYVILENFEFYRIVQNGMVKLGSYSTFNEIFVYQNFVALRKDICHLIKPKSLKSLNS